MTGNTYRLAHGAAFPVKKVKFAAPTLPDGRAIRAIDPEIICVGDRRYPLKYRSDGTGIFHLAAGPNQTAKCYLHDNAAR